MIEQNEDYTEKIRRITWLQARAKIAMVLLETGVADTHNDQVGFWTQIAGNPTFLSLYDLLGDLDD
jgi:hypothetical protein